MDDYSQGWSGYSFEDNAFLLFQQEFANRKLAFSTAGQSIAPLFAVLARAATRCVFAVLFQNLDTDRRRGRQAGRQTDRQTDRQTNRHIFEPHFPIPKLRRGPG